MLLLYQEGLSRTNSSFQLFLLSQDQYQIRNCHVAELLSSAIDYYVKNITITGTLITTGSPWVHTVSITPAPTPITAGKIPNTLAISS